MKETARKTYSCNDAIRIHLRELSKISLLDPKEELELAKKAREGDKVSRERLLTANMRFVIKVAKKFQNRGIELEDLISEGYVGLVEAVEHFDPSRGYHFISYSVWWIRQKILKAIYEKGSAIRLPANKTAELIQIKKATANIKDSLLSEEKELNEVAKMLGMTNYHVREMMNLSRDMLSLDKPLTAEGDMCLADTLASSDFSDPVENAMKSCASSEIIDSLKDNLGLRDAAIIRMRYGLEGEGAHSLDEVGKKFNLSKERVRQIEKKAIKFLRSEKSDALADFVA